jgi:hypothetical protein
MKKDAAERIRVQPGKGIGISADRVADLGTKVLTSVQFVMVAAGYSSGDHSGHAQKTRASRDEAAKPAWRIPYKDAILEADQGQLADRIRAAEAAIRARASLDGQVSSEKRIAIQHAMAGLLVLRREMAQSSVDKIKSQRDARGPK